MLPFIGLEIAIISSVYLSKKTTYSFMKLSTRGRELRLVNIGLLILAALFMVGKGKPTFALSSILLISFIALIAEQLGGKQQNIIRPANIYHALLPALLLVSVLQFGWLASFNPLQKSEWLFTDIEKAPILSEMEKNKILSANGKKILSQAMPTLQSDNLSVLAQEMPYLFGSIIAGWGIPTPYRVQYYPFASNYITDISQNEIKALNGYAHLSKKDNDKQPITRDFDVVTISPNRFTNRQ